MSRPVALQSACGNGPMKLARDSALRRRRGTSRLALLLVAACCLCTAIAARAQHWFYHDVIAAPPQLPPGVPRTVQGTRQCVQSCVTSILNGRQIQINLEDVLLMAPVEGPQGTRLSSGARVLRQEGIRSNGHTIRGDPPVLRSLANNGRPIIAGVEGPDLNHALIVEGTVRDAAGNTYYVVKDSARGAPHGGRYLKPARTMELVTTHVLEPLPEGVRSDITLNPERPEFDRWAASGISKAPISRMIGGAVSGAAFGAASTFVLCKALGNSTADCLAAAGQSVPDAAFWGAVAATSELGGLLAAAYGAGVGAVAIGEASLEFARLVDAIIEESSVPTGDVEALVRTRVPQLLAAEQRSLAQLQQLLDSAGTRLESARQPTAGLEQAMGQLQTLQRRLEDARQRLEQVRATCQTNQQRHTQLKQFLSDSARSSPPRLHSIEP